MLTILNILLISIGVGMDTFAVCLCKGFLNKNLSLYKIFLISFCFGIFHIIMPSLGSFLGDFFRIWIQKADHWFAFIILSFIGIKMIYESLKDNEETNINNEISLKTIFFLSFALSIDAFAVGITLPFLKLPLIISIISMGFTIFLLSILGIFLGKKLGDHLGNHLDKKAEIFGGLILLFIGLKILLEHINS